MQHNFEFGVILETTLFFELWEARREGGGVAMFLVLIVVWASREDTHLQRGGVMLGFVVCLLLYAVLLL